MTVGAEGESRQDLCEVCWQRGVRVPMSQDRKTHSLSQEEGGARLQSVHATTCWMRQGGRALRWHHDPRCYPEPSSELLTAVYKTRTFGSISVSTKAFFLFWLRTAMAFSNLLQKPWVRDRTKGKLLPGRGLLKQRGSRMDSWIRAVLLARKGKARWMSSCKGEFLQKTRGGNGTVPTWWFL